jgi:adenosylmethionine-8-amino-7-oxononanoate aminotransferase
LTFAGHPVSCAVANANLDAFESEDVLEHVRSMTGGFRERMESLRDTGIVGDVRGDGFFWAVELVRDIETAERFDRSDVPTLLASTRDGIRERGVIARGDDRGDPVVQVCPPLLCTDADLDLLVDALRGALVEAKTRFIG